MADSNTTNLQDDVETIRRLIDLASFTTSETLLAAKFRADEAIDRIEAALNETARISRMTQEFIRTHDWREPL